MPVSALPSTHVVRRPAAMLGDAPFAALLIDNPHDQAAAVTALLAELAVPDVRVVRLHDGTQPHRTLRRIVDQVAGPSGEVVRGDQARLIVRALAERQGCESRVVLVIERAETLRPELLRSLQAMAPYFDEGHQPALQVLFVGRPIFRTLLDQRGIAPLRQALGMGPNVPAPALAPIPRRASRKPLLLLLALLAGAGGAGYFALREPAPSFDRAFRPPDVAPRSEVPPQADPAPSNATGSIAPPAANPVAAPAVVPAGPARPRFVLHVPSGSEAADALSTRLVTALEPRFGTVEVRRVPDTPSRPSLRYFYAADEPVARQAADRMADNGLSWAVRDFSSYRPLPSRGTVEVWVPRPADRAIVGQLAPEPTNQR